MTITTNPITAATQAVRIDVPTYVGAAACWSPVIIEPAVRERALAPIAAMSQGHVRLGDDATGFAGNPAWSPPT